MSTKRQVSENLVPFHCRLPRQIKDGLMSEASKQGISAASLLTKLVEKHMFGEKKDPMKVGKPSVIHQDHDIEDNQVDIENWLAAHGSR